MRLRVQLVLNAVALAAMILPVHAADNDAAIKNALSAAPAGVAKDASVMLIDAKGNMTIVKKGTNGFTCVPDDPSSPTNDPMCIDQNAMLWMEAYMSHAVPPPDGKVGIGYMLQGDFIASNIDPYSTTPVNGKWLVDGPHMMIFSSQALLEAYPHNVTATPDVSHPYVMFAGTPYAHLMVPLTP